MNIKSLLLGSAAALVAVSGARAADAVVIAEPEPVEYVRVCDAYGAGFFYIPGTETCISLGGYVRMQVEAPFGQVFRSTQIAGQATPNDLTDDVFATGYDDVVDGWRFVTRSRLNVDVRSDTEWGTLRGFMRFQADTRNNADANVGIDQAIVQLGGLYMGYTESAFAAPWGLPGFARFGILHTDDGGPYAYQQKQQIGYIFSANGLTGSIVLEDDVVTGDGYVPDIVGNLAYGQSWGGIYARVGYDESASEATFTGAVQYNFAPGSSIRIGGFYATDPNSYTPGMIVSGQASEWSVQASLAYAFNPTLTGVIGGAYLEDFQGDNAWQVQAALVWVPVNQFEVRLEGRYGEEENLPIYNGTATPGLGDREAGNVFLRFTRYF